jgi:hypothetical protein
MTEAEENGVDNRMSVQDELARSRTNGILWSAPCRTGRRLLGLHLGTRRATGCVLLYALFAYWVSTMETVNYISRAFPAESIVLEDELPELVFQTSKNSKYKLRFF